MSIFMFRDLRIKDVKENTFRTELYLKDVLCDFIVLVEPEKLKDELIPEDRDEVIGVCYTNPVCIPSLGSYYTRKAKDIKTKHFDSLLDRLVFMNPGINFEGLKSMVEFTEEKFLIKGIISKRNLLKAIIKRIHNLKEYNPDDLTKTRIVFYSDTSVLSKGEKISLSLKYRGYRQNHLLGEVLHNTAEVAMLRNSRKSKWLKLSKKKVYDIITDSRVQTRRTFDKYLQPRTVNALIEYNAERVFKSDKVLEKYKEYIAENMICSSTRSVAERLSISFTTVNQFKQLKNEEEYR